MPLIVVHPVHWGGRRVPRAYTSPRPGADLRRLRQPARRQAQGDHRTCLARTSPGLLASPRPPRSTRCTTRCSTTTTCSPTSTASSCARAWSSLKQGGNPKQLGVRRAPGHDQRGAIRSVYDAAVFTRYFAQAAQHAHDPGAVGTRSTTSSCSTPPADPHEVNNLAVDREVGRARDGDEREDEPPHRSGRSAGTAARCCRAASKPPGDGRLLTGGFRSNRWAVLPPGWLGATCPPFTRTGPAGTVRGNRGNSGQRRLRATWTSLVSIWQRASDRARLSSIRMLGPCADTSSNIRGTPFAGRPGCAAAPPSRVVPNRTRLRGRSPEARKASTAARVPIPAIGRMRATRCIRSKRVPSASLPLIASELWARPPPACSSWMTFLAGTGRK